MSPRVKHLRIPKARRRIQRTFLKWFAKSRSRFTMPPHIVSRTERMIVLTFPQLTALRVWVDSSIAISIWVEWGGSQDWIGDFECIPKKAGDGAYDCELCRDYNNRFEPGRPELVEKYPTRQSLWINHSFEPFLEWCNKDLASSHWLALFKHGEDEWCEARLLPDDTETEKAYVLFPVRETRYAVTLGTVVVLGDTLLVVHQEYH